jgi:hypothetical protein
MDTLSKRCNECLHYKHVDEYNEDEGECRNPSMGVMHWLHWLDGEPVEAWYPVVNAFTCFCDNFEYKDNRLKKRVVHAASKKGTINIKTIKRAVRAVKHNKLLSNNQNSMKENRNK